MKLEEVLMGPQIYGKMKDIFLDMVLKKNKAPNFKEFYKELKSRYPYIKTNMETIHNKSQVNDIENQQNKYREYKDAYNYIAKEYKHGKLRR